ncbi:MAG: RDD family protein [Terracoccus sp.]
MSQQPAGWYDDPSNPDMLRYWDGVTWSDHTAPRKSPTASSSSGGPDYQGQRPTAPSAQRQPSQPPMPQGSGWQDQAQQGQQGQQGQLGQQGQFGQAPQYPGAPGSPGSQGAANWMHSIKTTSDGVPLASWGRRLGAWVIDGVILVILTYVGARVFVPGYIDTVQQFVDAAGAQDQPSMNALVSQLTSESAKAGLVSWVITAVYCIAFWTTTAQTPGKMAVGISVRRADQPGPLDLLTSVRRRLISIVQILPVVGGIYFLIFLIDYLWPLWDDKRQALHDKVAQTQVVMGKQPRAGSIQRP